MIKIIAMGLLLAFTPTKSNASVTIANYNMTSVIKHLQETERYTPRAKWDVQQYSYGYGSKARYNGQYISKYKAELLLRKTVKKIARKVIKFCPKGTSKGTIDALVSLSYNSGCKWMRSGLGKAVKSKNRWRIRKKFKLYKKVRVKVRGKYKLVTSLGLKRRRAKEVRWI